MRIKYIALTAMVVLFITLLWPSGAAFRSLMQPAGASEPKLYTSLSNTEPIIAEQKEIQRQAMSGDSDGRLAFYIFSSNGEPVLLFLLGVILLSAATCIKLKLLKRQVPEKRVSDSIAVEQLTPNGLPSGRQS